MLSFSSLFGEDAAVLRDRNFQILLLTMAIVPLGNSLLSPILDSLVDPFGTSAADIGLMITFFWAPSIVIVPIAGVLADRYGRKAVLVPAIVLFGIGGMAIAFTTDFRLVLALRLLQGIGWAGISPIVITSIGDLYTGAREATAQGLRVTGAGVIGSAVPLVAGGLVLAAWQFPFLVYAVSFPVAVVVAIWFDEPAEEADGPDDDVSGEADASPDGGAPRSYLRELTVLVRRRRVLSILFARALPLTVWIGFVTYNSIIVGRLMDGSPVEAGILYGVASLVFALSASQAGRVTGLFESRFVPLAAGTALLGLGFGVVLFAPVLAVAGLGITVAGTGFGITVSLYTSVLTGLSRPSLRGGLVSLGATTSRAVGTLTPIALGAAITLATPAVGFEAAVRVAGLGAIAVGSGLSILCLLLARFSPPVPDAPTPAF